MTIDFICAPFRGGFFAHLPQRFDCQPDLLFGVGRGEREAQRAAVDGHRREQRGRDQDAVLPKHIARLDDVGYSADPYADQREQSVVVHGEPQVASPRDQLPGQAQQTPADNRSLVVLGDPQPRQGARQASRGARPGEDSGRRHGQPSLLVFVRATDEGGHRGKRLRHAADVDDVVAVAQAEVADDAVAQLPVGVVRRGVLAYDAETVGVVHVHPGAVLARQPRELRKRRIGAGHRVDAVYGYYLPGPLPMVLQPLLQVVRVVVVEPVHDRTPGSGELGRLLHRIVGGPIQEDRAVAAREHGQDAAVEQGDGWKHQDVRGPDEPCDLPLEVLVDLRRSHGHGPARVRAPTLYRHRDRGLNRGVQIQAQVLRGREIRVPAPVDLDVPTVLLAHDGTELRNPPEYPLLQLCEPVRRRRIPCAGFGGFAYRAADVFDRPQIGDAVIAKLQTHLEGHLHLD